MAKAANWALTDAEARKCGEQTGLDTLVVHTVNDEMCIRDRCNTVQRVTEKQMTLFQSSTLLMIVQKTAAVRLYCLSLIHI